MSEATKDINIITMAFIKGILPITKEEKICGYPNCNHIFKGGSDRAKHWIDTHKHKTCPQHNPLEEILEILGIDVITKTIEGEKIGYIRSPLFKCPLHKCKHAAHKSGKLLEHIRSAHKNEYELVKSLSPLHKIFWLLKTSNKPITLDNIIYKGEAFQCKKCGWCTTNKIASSNHIAVLHREDKMEGKKNIRKITMEYEYGHRNGSSISPFVGTINDEENEYFIVDIKTGNTEERTKAEIIRMTKEKHNKDNTQTNITKRIPTTQQPPQVIINQNNQTNHISPLPLPLPLLQTPQHIEENYNNHDTQNIQEQQHEDEEEENSTTEDEDKLVQQMSKQEPTEEQTKQTKQKEHEEYLSEEAINKALEWHQDYYNMQESIPKFKAENRKALTEAMNCAIKEEIMPLLYTLEKKKIPEEAPTEEVVNGVLSFCFHVITENAKRALGIMKKRNKNSTMKKRTTFAEKIQNKKKARDAGSRIASNIATIEKLRNDNIPTEVLQNREDVIIDDTITQVIMLSDEMKMAIFNTTNITREIIIDTINNVINQNGQTNIITYIEHANNEILEMEDCQKKIITKKTRDLFRLSPRRAMKYYMILIHHQTAQFNGRHKTNWQQDGRQNTLK